jgi:hypothetical protein
MIFEGPLEAEPPTRRFDDQRHVLAGILRLGAGMQPGEYLLQVSVRDGGRRGKQWTSQFIDFEVLPAQARVAGR